MNRYVVERTFPNGLIVPTDHSGASACMGVVTNNAEERVTWITSYVSTDKKRTYCVYDGPTPEAVRRVAEVNSLPVEKITEVRVLDPYFYF